MKFIMKEESSNNEYDKFKKGVKFNTRYSEVLTVLLQERNQIFVEEKLNQ